MTNEREEVASSEALRESMQRWIDYHSARADKAEALVGELVDALYLAENACEFLCQFDEGSDDFPPITDAAIPAIKEAITEAEAWLEERK